MRPNHCGLSWRLRSLALTIMAVAGGAVAPPSHADPPSKILRDHMEVLRTSKDRDALEKASLAIVESADKEATPFLRELLVRPEFLDRLDRKDEYLVANRMRLLRVLSAVARAWPESWRYLLSLSEQPAYLPSHSHRSLALIAASGFCPKPGEPLISWLRGHLWRQKVEESNSLKALVRLESPLVTALLVEAILDPGFSVGHREVWIFYDFIGQRYTEKVMPVYRTAVEKAESDTLAASAIEALVGFDGRWYYDHGVPETPPGYDTLTLARLRELLEILRIAEAKDIKPNETQLPRPKSLRIRDVAALIRTHKPRIEALIREREREEKEKKR